MTNEQLWTDADTEALRGIGQFHGSPHNLLGRRAADEIERLRGKLDFANREPPHCSTCNCGQHEPLLSGNDGRTVWEKARDAINEAIRQAPDINRRVLAINALHEIAEAMRGTPCTESKEIGAIDNG